MFRAPRGAFLFVGFFLLTRRANRRVFVALHA